MRRKIVGHTLMPSSSVIGWPSCVCVRLLLSGGKNCMQSGSQQKDGDGKSNDNQ